MTPQQLAAQQRKSFERLVSTQNKQQDSLFKQYKSAVAGQENLTDVFQRAQQERGIGDYQNAINLFQGQIGDVKGLLDRLDENTASRTSGTGANQAYLDRLRAVEGGQLNTQLGRLSAGLEPVVQAYGLAQQDVGQLLELTQADQQRRLKPLETQVNSLGDRFAREITGFTSTRQNELDTLVAKIARQQQLSDREWQAAQQLAAEEREFQRQRSLNARSSSNITGYFDDPNEGEKAVSRPSISHSSGGGFNFKDAQGRPITAAGYVNATGGDFMSLLQRMAQQGDRNAIDVIKNGNRANPGALRALGL